MANGLSIYHYASKEDYKSVMLEVSKRLSIKYVVDEWLLTPTHKVFDLATDTDNFGQTLAPHDAGLTIFLILPQNSSLPFGYRPERKVPEKYGLVPSVNLNYPWVYLHASSIYNSEQWGQGMVEGWLCTNSNHPDSLAIFKIFKKTIKDQFEYFKTSGVYVGQQAAKMYDSGLRLSQDLRNSSERDIKK